ncbi:MAG TPA: hypothetical protein VNF73_14600 [Candidatus Saccharimonadales bacterium]|nr:hypothetical protein [Candidatus Saccharimonadales bacterium]
MAASVECYTRDARIVGTVGVDGRLIDLLGMSTAIVLENCVTMPLGTTARHLEPRQSIEVDDLLLVVARGTVTPAHAAWHSLSVLVGPYVIRGELPSLPGFDPNRALARPGGSFILLGNVCIEAHAAQLGLEREEHAFAWVNRYAVEAIESDLELGFFFPGAMKTAATGWFPDTRVEA